MAAGVDGKRAIPSTLQQSFGCSECGTSDDTMADPVVLPCNHPICLQCLETQVKQAVQKDEVECQRCQQKAPIPPGGPKAFPKATSESTEVTKQAFTDPEADQLRACDQEKPACGVHPDEIITLYCWRCKVKVCTKCVEEQHNRFCELSVQTLQETADRMDRTLADNAYYRQIEVSRTIETLKTNWFKMRGEVDEPGKQSHGTARSARQWQDDAFQDLMDKMEAEKTTLTEQVQQQGIWKVKENP